MEENKTTPDKKLKSLLSSFICKPQIEKGNKRKRSITETETSADESGVFTPIEEIQSISDKTGRRKIDSQDEEAYFERVESYTMMTWFAKPPELSPLICSRYGWKNTEIDILQCVGCKAVLCGQLPKSAESLLFHESCRKLIDNLRKAHQKSCFWPAYPSSESYSTIPIKDKRKVTSFITAYIDSLQKLQNRLPQISFKSFEDKEISANYLEEMKCTAEKQLEHCYLDNIDLGTFCLAITGWKISDDKSGLLSCHYCRRKVGLWNYKNNLNVSIRDSSEESDLDIKSPAQTNSSENMKEDVGTNSKSANQADSFSPVRPTGTIFDNSKKNQKSNNNQDNSEGENSHVDSQTSLLPYKIYNFSQPSDLDCSVSDSNNETNEKKNTVSSLLSDESKEHKFVFSQPEFCQDLEDLESDGSKIDHGSNAMEVCNDSCGTAKNERIDEKAIEIECNKNENLVSETQNLIDGSEFKSRLNGGNSQSSMSVHNSVVSNDGVMPNQNENLNETLNGNPENRPVSEMVESSHTANSDVPQTSQPITSNNKDGIDQEKNSSKLRRKRIKAVKRDSFDPLEEHRYWCPWVNKLPEKISYSPQKILDLSKGDTGKSSYPWEHVLQIICPTFFDASQEDSMSEHFKQHSPVAGLRQLRKLMKDWSN